MARSPEKPEKLWSVADLADAWGLSPNLVYDYIANGELPYLNMGNGRTKVRVRQAAVDAFLARRNSEKPAVSGPRLRSVEDVA